MNHEFKVGDKVLTKAYYTVCLGIIKESRIGFYEVECKDGMNKGMSVFRHPEDIVPLPKNCSKLKIEFLKLLME